MHVLASENYFKGFCRSIESFRDVDDIVPVSFFFLVIEFFLNSYIVFIEN